MSLISIPRGDLTRTRLQFKAGGSIISRTGFRSGGIICSIPFQFPLLYSRVFIKPLPPCSVPLSTHSCLGLLPTSEPITTTRNGNKHSLPCSPRPSKIHRNDLRRSSNLASQTTQQSGLSRPHTTGPSDSKHRQIRRSWRALPPKHALTTTGSRP